MNLDTLLQTHYVRDLISKTCGDNTEIIHRHAAHFIRNADEGDRKVERIIILPPRGFTANAPEQMNSHDEAESATIEIKGAVRDGKDSVSVVKNCVFVASIDKNEMVSELNEPYLTFDIAADEPHVEKKLHSAGTAPFYVVRSDGYGFYHNIINVTDDWLVLKLVKTLRPQRKVDLSILNTYPSEQAMALNQFYTAVAKHGDEIFDREKELVSQICGMPLSTSLPALGEMLYIHDSGKHEACTVFATILKIAKTHPLFVQNFLRGTLENGSVPSYYAYQLLEKIARRSAAAAQGRASA